MIHVDNQMELNVSTIQPDEAYLLYITIDESWDDTREDPYDDDEDCLGFGCGRTVRTYRANNHVKELVGVVVDDEAHVSITNRMQKYVDINVKHYQTVSHYRAKPNYEVVVKYHFEKAKRLLR